MLQAGLLHAIWRYCDITSSVAALKTTVSHDLDKVICWISSIHWVRSTLAKSKGLD